MLGAGEQERGQGRRKARTMTPMRARKRTRIIVHMQPADDFSSILRMAIVALDTLHITREEEETSIRDVHKQTNK